MDEAAVGALIRQIVQFLGSMAVTWGYLSSDTVSTVVGGVVSFITACYAVYSRRKTEMKKTALLEQNKELKAELKNTSPPYGAVI